MAIAILIDKQDAAGLFQVSVTNDDGTQAMLLREDKSETVALARALADVMDMKNLLAERFQEAMRRG